MAHKPNIHTTYNQQAANWRNITEGASRPSKIYETKQEAQAIGREMARNRHVEQLIHNKNGEIGSRNSYGHDPRNVKG
ncbi:MAG TPA: DUF2188 domain-containing protein [Candidatus Saccharimonadales bacterium]|nr:DUF2188 domain-containing protein [Candidatus Saccharimonadales bacterium]